MKKKLLLVCMALVSLLSVSALTPPVNSTTNGSDVWYYIRSFSRTTDITAKWLTGAAVNGVVTVAPFNNADASQLWKVVNNPAGGFALVNKQFGTYLGTDVVYNSANLNLSVLPCVATPPAIGLKAVGYVDQTSGTSSGVPNGFYLVDKDATTVDNTANTTPKFQFYSAGNGSTFRPINYGTGTPNINSAVIFMSAKEALNDVMAIATTLKASTKAGADPGQYTVAAATSLQSAITTAQTAYSNAASSDTELATFATALNTQILAYKAAIIVPIISTPGNDRWYFLQGLRPTNSYMTSPAQGVYTQIKDLPVIPDDSQLWKFVPNPNGTANGFVLQNKLTGSYLDTDAGSGAILPVDLMPINNLRFIVSNEYTADKTTRFWIENAVGSTPILRYHAGASNSNWGLINWSGNAADNSTWLIIDYNTGLKTIVNEQLIKAKALRVNATEGTLPGQFPAASIEALQGSIDFGQSVVDDVNASSADCILAVTDLNAIVARFASEVITPTISTPGADTWYYIQGAKNSQFYLRSNGVTPAWMYANQVVLNDDRFLWKIVPNTNGTNNGYALQNKANSEYLNTDKANLTSSATVPAMPIVNLKFVGSDVYTNGVNRFWIKDTGATTTYILHEGGDHAIWNYLGASTGDGTWLFVSTDEVVKLDYLAQRTRARSVYTTSIEGTEFGQYSAAARATYDAAIAAEEAKDANTMTAADFSASVTAMNDAKAVFNCNRDVTTLASVTKMKWFRLVNAQYPAGYATDKAMTSNGRTVDTKFTYEAINLTSDAQLFRFDMNADGTKATTIINKATGLYFGSDGMMVSAPTADNEFQIIPLDGATFWIKPTTKDPIHAAQANSDILNWNSGVNSASAWKFVYVSSQDITDFLPSYQTKRTQTRAKYDAATIDSGDQIGQYKTAPIAALSTVITAEEAKVATTLTQAQLLQGILDMNAATAALTVNTDIKLLVSATPTTVKWFRLINGAATSVAYASGMAMSSNGKLVTEPFTFEAKDVNSDAQLFKFVLNSNQTNVASIYNKGVDLFLAPTGTMITKDSIAKVTNEFEIIQLAGGRTFWIHPTYIDATDSQNSYRVSPLHAAQNGSVILNWNAGVGSASAWMFEFVKEEATSVKTVEAFNYRVRTTNHIVTVDGVENFEVYSLLGQQQNNKKALSNGVYFVKVNNAVKKVIID